MYSRNIPMAEKNMEVILISNNYYIYLKKYFEIIVTNEFLLYSGGQHLLSLQEGRMLWFSLEAHA